MNAHGVVPAIITALAGILLAGIGQAATLRVPEDHPSVLAALDAAAVGDTVLVGPGTWTEADSRETPYIGLNFLRSNGFMKLGTTLIGTAGAEATIIEGLPTSPQIQHMVLVIPGTDVIGPPVHIEGLTIRGAGGLFRGVASSIRSDILVKDCIFEESGVGIRSRGPDLTIRDSVFRYHDTASLDPVAALDGVESDWLIEDCVFEGNIGPFILENFAVGSSRTIIRRCTFRSNHGRVVSFARQDPLLIEDCVFVDNIGRPNSSGRCISLNECDAEIVHNTFVGNTAEAPGSALFASFETRLELTHNTFVDNTIPGPSIFAGLAFDTHVEIDFRENVIVGTRGGAAVGIHSNGFVQPGGGCNVFWDNGTEPFYRYEPTATDLEADPLFCSPDTGDFTVSSVSPCLPGQGVPGCGQIGAWGEGCGTVSLESKSWSRIKSLYRRED